MKRRMQKAGDSGARYAIIFGDDELDRGEVAIKSLNSGQQESLTLAELVRVLPDRLIEDSCFDATGGAVRREEDGSWTVGAPREAS